MLSPDRPYSKPADPKNFDCYTTKDFFLFQKLKKNPNSYVLKFCLDSCLYFISAHKRHLQHRLCTLNVNKLSIFVFRQSSVLCTLHTNSVNKFCYKFFNFRKNVITSSMCLFIYCFFFFFFLHLPTSLSLIRIKKHSSILFFNISSWFIKTKGKYNNEINYLTLKKETSLY